MRYFLHLAYNGTRYYGWQRQPNAVSVQETLEDALSTILNSPVEITGCGRTDTGVHARQYYAHFDFEGDFPEAFLRRLNKFLPPEIAVYELLPVAEDAHARYDAIHRAYEYHLTFSKDPFRVETRYFYPFPVRLQLDAMNEAAALLLEYDHFFTFCKSDTDVRTMRCDLRRSEWLPVAGGLVYHIAADRFLRGMVRLIVGMCLHVGSGKTRLEEVRWAMDHQERLPQAQSAPPQGLFLTEVKYPYI